MNDNKKPGMSEELKKKLEEIRSRPRSPRPSPPDAITLELLQATPDERLSQLVMDFVCGRRKLARAMDLREFIRQFSPGMRMVYTTTCVEGEVGNGGLHQFFFNSSGQLAEIAIEGFELLGMPAFAELMRRAIARLLEEKEMQSRIRENRTLDTFFASYKETNLGELDKEFYALNLSCGGLRSLRNQYVKGHLEEFISNSE